MYGWTSKPQPPFPCLGYLLLKVLEPSATAYQGA